MQQATTDQRQRRDRGYNLVEVLIAMAVLGIILLTVLTLFVMGRRNVYSGRQLSAANAVATRVLEDLALMSASDVIDSFVLNGSPLRTNIVAGVEYENSILRDANGTLSSTTNDAGGYLARWRTLVDTNAELPSGRVVLVVTPMAPVVAASPVQTAQVLRLRGVVEWREGVRTRSVAFDSSKVQRP
ncbi:MAG TPA: prepilin-type N-terminal cleavage/methylation domain-containing protein [Thermoanaerobaculia bacterium]|jgi:prepilin-type N-terminal cleavage/methylation domain-containing protein